MLKSAVELTIARGKFSRGTYTEVPSLAPPIFTSNKILPKDDALLRRFIVLPFTFGERIDPARAIEFGKEVKPRLDKLKAIGYYVARKIIENPSLLDNNWIELAEKMLEGAYKEAGLQAPSWIKLRVEHDLASMYEDLKEI